MRFCRARLVTGILLVFVLAAAGVPASAQDMRFFRIGTGDTGGTYYPIGGLIANAISAPPGSRPCELGGACGVKGLVAVAVATHGSVSNIRDLQNGRLEAAFLQSDVAFWGYSGTGIFNGQPPAPELRVIAYLYPETVHLVVRRDSGISGIPDLKGKKVSLNEIASGTLADARLVLGAFGLTERDITPFYLRPSVAGAKLAAGEIDAFFFVGGAPVEAIAALAETTAIALVPIAGATAERALTRYSFFSFDEIPAGTYPGVGATATMSVGAMLVTSAAQSEELIFDITAALWNANTRKQLDRVHTKGRLIRAENALKGLAIPLHPGAERYYRKAGLLAQ